MNTKVALYFVLLIGSMFTFTAFGQDSHCRNSDSQTSGIDTSPNACNRNNEDHAGNSSRDTASNNSADEEQQNRHGMRRSGMGGRGAHMNMSHERHHLVKRDGIPAEYSGLASPLQQSAENSRAGKSIYEENCASCHGPVGEGNGAAGLALTPKPTNIARFAQMNMAKDDYLFWTISEGGAVVSSAMPAFKEALTTESIWQVIMHLRELSPEN